MQDAAKKLLHRFDAAQKALLDIACIVFLAATILIVLFQVFNRFWFNISAPWTEEFSRYIFVYLCILGITRGVRDDLHIKLELLVNLFPQKVQTVVNVLIDALVIIVLGGVAVSGIEFLPVTMTRRAATVNFSMYYLYIAIPVSAIVMILFLLKRNIETLLTWWGSNRAPNES